MTHQSHSAKPCPTATLVQRLRLPTIYKVLQPLGKVYDPASEGKVVWWPNQLRQDCIARLLSSISHLVEVSSKLYCTGFLNSSNSTNFRLYKLLNHEYLNKLWYRGDDNWLCIRDCNFVILFRSCKFISLSNSKTVSENL